MVVLTPNEQLLEDPCLPNFWKTLALKVPSLLLGRGHNYSSQVNLFLLVFKIKLRKGLVFNMDAKWIYFFSP